MSRFFTQGSFAIQRLVLVSVVFAGLVVPLMSQKDNVAVELETWYQFEPEEEFSLEGSRYLVKDVSKTDFYENVPAYLRRADSSKNSFGFRFAWDRRGANFVDVVPEKKIKFKGKVLELTMWIWGGGYTHEILGLFKDNTGTMIGANFGKLNYYGWKKRSAHVPHAVSVRKNVDGDGFYYFDRFRVVSDPRGKVNNLYVFLDKIGAFVQFDRLTGYDGDELEEVIRNELGSDIIDGENASGEATTSGSDSGTDAQ